MKMKLIHSIVLCLFIVMLIACGKKGLPKPPESLAPLPVNNFLAQGSLDGINLTWLAPQKTANGNDLKDLDRFFVFRSVVVRDESPEYKIIQEITVVEDLELTDQKTKIPEPHVYNYLDKDVKPGKEYDYYVVPVNQGGTKGKESPVLRVTFVGQSSAVRILPSNETEY